MGRFLREFYEFGISLLNLLSWFCAIVLGSAIALTIHAKFSGVYSSGIGTWLNEEGAKLIGVYGGGASTWLIQEGVQSALFAASVWGILATRRKLKRERNIAEENQELAERKSKVSIGGLVAVLFEFVGLSRSSLVVVMVLGGLLLIFVLIPAKQEEEKTADATFVRVFSKLLVEQSRDQVNQVLAGMFLPNTQLDAKKPSRTAFNAYCCRQIMFASTRYDLQLEYDTGDQLSFARLLKSHDSDGQVTDCSVLAEIPSNKGKAYPFLCPPNVQDF